jgi:hypothetical protein
VSRLSQLGYAGQSIEIAAATALHLHNTGHSDEMVFETLAATYPPAKG